jgi:hypothetical protein
VIAVFSYWYKANNQANLKKLENGVDRIILYAQEEFEFVNNSRHLFKTLADQSNAQNIPFDILIRVLLCPGH